MGLYPKVWKYRTITDHQVAGQRFRIEEAYNDKNTGMGYEYFVDDLEVTPMVFERALAVAKLKVEETLRVPKRRVA